MTEKILFEETQYSGYNKYSLFVRLSLAIFCFVNYFLNPSSPSGCYFFYMGIAILVISALLIFIPHLKTKLTNGKLELNGFWTTKSVTIDLENIIRVKKVIYKRSFFNKSAYNLHRKGKRKFFTRGSEAVKLTTKEGLYYIIGSQRVNELQYILSAEVKRIQNKN